MKYTIIYIVALIGLSCSSLLAQTYTQEIITDTTQGFDGGAEEIYQEDEVYFVIEENPSLKEGSIKEYIQQHYIISKKIKKEGQPGKIFVSFIVEKDGTLSNVEVLKGLSDAQNDEAIRVMQSTSGMWIPAKINGMSVKAAHREVISFTEEELKSKKKQ